MIRGTTEVSTGAGGETSKMDENLFQLVTVGLLGVTLLVLLVTLLTLNKVAKKVEGGAQSRAEGPYQGEDEAGAPPGQLAPAPSEQAASTPEAAAQESTFPAARAEEPEPVVEHKEPEVVGAAQVEEVRPVAAAGPAVQEPEPAPTSTGFEDAPEEQPFERDGRWWFKRGDELLVYDEQSGQWESAPAGTTAAAAAAPVVPAADSGPEQGSDAPVAGGEAEPAQAAQDPGSFWKCPSCGAVNGSTATSCRMCFAPKP
jgi:hypothetical protein